MSFISKTKNQSNVHKILNGKHYIYSQIDLYGSHICTHWHFCNPWYYRKYVILDNNTGGTMFKRYFIGVKCWIWLSRFRVSTAACWAPVVHFLIWTAFQNFRVAYVKTWECCQDRDMYNRGSVIICTFSWRISDQTQLTVRIMYFDTSMHNQCSWGPIIGGSSLWYQTKSNQMANTRRLNWVKQVQGRIMWN